MMFAFAKFTPRMWLILAHDVLVTAAAVLASFYIRFEDTFLDQRRDLLVVLLPGILIYAAIVYALFGLNRSKWRFTSLPEFVQILRAAGGMAGALVGRGFGV